MKRITRTHLHKHNITTDEYKSLYPDAPIVSDALAYKLGAASRNMGETRRQEVAKQLSEANRGRPKSKDHRAKLSAARTGVSWGSHSEEHKAALSQRSKEMWVERKAEGWVAPPQSEEARERTRQGVIAIRKVKHWSGPSNKGKKLNLSEEQRANRSRKAAANMNSKKSKDTSLEIMFEDFCVEREIDFEKQRVLHWERGAFSYDFYLPASNLLVEIDGEYWHRTAKAMNRDRIKEEVALEQGFEFVRISNADWCPEIVFAPSDERKAKSAAIMLERFKARGTCETRQS